MQLVLDERNVQVPTRKDCLMTILLRHFSLERRLTLRSQGVKVWTSELFVPFSGPSLFPVRMV
jgi:hypothetical protein